MTFLVGTANKGWPQFMEFVGQRKQIFISSKKFTIAFHCSEMASLSDGTSGEYKNLKKVSKLMARASQITYFILVLIHR